MIRSFLLIILFILSIILHIAAANSNDLINKQIEKNLNAPTYKNNDCFTQGSIFMNGDTLRCEVFCKNKKSNGFDKSMYTFVIVRFSDDSIVALNADKINGFCVNNNYFKSHTCEISREIRSFFIRLVEDGKVHLFERDGYILDKSRLYYLHFGQTNHYIVINPESENLLKESDMGGQIVNSITGRINVHTQRINDSFKIYFSNMFKDCVTVRNKILSDFYNRNNLETIVKEYNACK